jgi:hypothetical protein
MNRIVRNSVFAIRGGLGLLAALCLLVLPTCAKAACGRFDAPGLKSAIKMPMVAQAAVGFPSPFEAANATIVGVWHVIYTNSADQSTFNDTRMRWSVEADGPAPRHSSSRGLALQSSHSDGHGNQHIHSG